ncbi:uncharacterized protein LOC111366872, partial [Olea europaea var. sylvestris]|uniref:uncharacterized protein LOC111366872 n=1 Tax=Olea europaea var. sylvestris TaxID=158386 RepID=UPI000C1D1C8C
KEEVQKLIQNGFIREATYPRWVSNPVLVRKNNGKWKVCIDFTNLNRACPKDSFPLPRIDQLVDSTAGHELLSFMDAYSGCNQIPMHPTDEEHTSFITDRGLYCYRMMPFGLKNVRATYQRLVNQMFVDLIGKTMEVYVDDMLVKSLEAEDHIKHLNSTFQILRRYRMRLNPHKCAFGVASGKFLGYMVNQRGIEANPEKIEALCKMRSPQKPKEVQSLTGRVAALSRFVSKATDKCLPFFKVMKAGKKFQWTEECEEAFQCLKRHLGQAPLLSKPKPGDILQLYLAISNEAINSVLQKPDASGRLLKWAVELSEFDLVFKARAAIKGQALTDFVAEFANLPKVDEIMEPIEPPMWNLFVDGSAGEVGSGAGVVLISPEGHKLTSAVRFGFKATNNAAEYKIPHIENAHADALSKLASSKDSELLTVVPIEHLLLPSIEAPTVMWVTGTPIWMQPIVAYLKDQRQPSQELTTVSTPWPFSKWSVDLIGPLPKGRGGASFTIVAIDYFTKWVEVEPLEKITEANTSKFLWKNIICRFGIPHSIVSDNGRQFDNKKVRELCEELGIKKHFSIPHHPQANGQVEAVNKTIKHILKRKLDVSKGA